MSFPKLEFEQSLQAPSYIKNDINKVQNPLQTYKPQSTLPAVPIDSQKSAFAPAKEYSAPPPDHLPSVVANNSSFTNDIHSLNRQQTIPVDHNNFKNHQNKIAPPATVQIQNQFLPILQAPLNYQNVTNINSPTPPNPFIAPYKATVAAQNEFNHYNENPVIFPPVPPTIAIQNQFQTNFPPNIYHSAPNIDNIGTAIPNNLSPYQGELNNSYPVTIVRGENPVVFPPATATMAIQNQFSPFPTNIQPNIYHQFSYGTAAIQNQFQPIQGEPNNQVIFPPARTTMAIQNQFLPVQTNFQHNNYNTVTYQASNKIQNQFQPIQGQLNNPVSVGRVSVKFICSSVMHSSCNSFFQKISSSSVSPPSSSCWHISQNYMGVGLHDGKVIIYHIPTKKNITSFQAHSGQVIALEFLKNTLITIGGEGKVRVWMWEEDKFLLKLKSQSIKASIRKEKFECQLEIKNQITSCGILIESNLIAIGTIVGEVIVYELVSEQEKKELNKGEEDLMNCKGLKFIEKCRYSHEEKVGAISFHPNKILLASGSQDSLIKVWNLNENKLQKEEKCGGPVFSLCFDEINNLYFRSSNFIRKFNLFYQNVISIKEGPSISSNYLLSISKKQASGGELLIWDEGKCIEIYHILNGQRFFALGKHDANDLCSLSFSPDGFKFISSGKDNTIRVWENDEFYEILLNGFLYWGQTPRIDHIIYLLNKMRLANENELPSKLFEFLFQLLPFPCIFYKLEDDSQKYLLASISKEKLVEINQNDFLSANNNHVGESKLFDLRILNIENSLEVSTDSILFLQKIQSFSIENDIFDNIAIKYLIEFKWRHFGKKLFLKNLYFYIIFTVLFTINVLWFLKKCDIEDQSNSYNILFFIFSGIIVCLDLLLINFEIKQFRAFGFYHHFKSFWNVLDLLVMICTPVSLIATSVAIHYQEDLYPFKLICAISFIFIWMRSFDYFRGFESTSVYVVIIFTVIENIKFFLGILLLFLFIFTSFYFLSTDQDPTSFLICLKIFYKLILGDFDDFEFDFDLKGVAAVAWIIFFISSLLFVIILLNLLIAIISDSHADIMKKLSRIIGREKINYLIDYESMITQNQIQLNNLNKELRDKFLIVADQNFKKMKVPNQVYCF